MPSVTNGRLLYTAHPTGFQEPGVHTQYVEEQIDLDAIPLNGGVLIKTLALSADPYLRMRMRDPKVDMTFPPFVIGRPVDNYAVGVVLRSDKPEFKQGDYVYGYLGFENYTIFPGPPEGQHILQSLTKLDKEPSLPASIYVGTLGMPGETAYAGWNAFIAKKAKKSKILFVSSAAGPVGTFVIEYARHFYPHLKIIASAGSPEKLEVLKESGADVVFNYKTANLDEVLVDHGPIDIFWDHVGGETLDTTLAYMNMFGLILRVGTASGYNTSENQAPKNTHAMIQKCLTMRGLIIGVGDEMQNAGKTFLQDATKLVLDGVIKSRETKYNELKEAGKALADVHRGKSFGKAVVVIDE